MKSKSPLCRKIFWSVLILIFCIPVPGTAGTEDFAYKDLHGKLHTLDNYKGKWVVVNYWATWCPPCREELPELEVFFNNNSPDKAVVLGLNMEDIDADAINAFVEEQFLSFPILPVGAAPSQPLGSIPGLPTTYLISPRGKVVARQVGGVTADMLENFIRNFAVSSGE